MDDALSREIVERREDLLRERQELLERKPPMSRDQLAEHDTVEILDKHMRVVALDPIGPQHLCHRQRIEALVPDEVHLVAAAATEVFDHGAPFRDLRSFLE